ITTIKFLVALSLATTVTALAIPPVEHFSTSKRDTKGSLQLIGSEIKSFDITNWRLGPPGQS
ncbi:hypothetical protein CABS02_01518, partial [Colletotrichum abscissum]